MVNSGEGHESDVYRLLDPTGTFCCTLQRTSNEELFGFFQEPIKWILGLEVNPSSNRVINGTPLVWISSLKAQSKQNYDSAIYFTSYAYHAGIFLSRFAVEICHFSREKNRSKSKLVRKRLSQGVSVDKATI